MERNGRGLSCPTSTQSGHSCGAVSMTAFGMVGEQVVKHALIIDDNVAVSRAIRDRLKQFGFVSFDWTWSEHQALKAAAVRRPESSFR